MNTIPSRDGHRIVVGVDGSPSSKTALRWAINQARLTGADVDAVAAWQFPPTFGPAPVINIYDYEDDARQILARAIAEMSGADGEVVVRPRVIHGHPAQVLLDAADGADLLVVGSRGHGGFTEALLGSVGQHCVHRAPCPVVIIRGTAPHPATTMAGTQRVLA